MNKNLHIGLWLVQALLALAFLASGIQKLVVPASEMFSRGATIFEGREWLWPFIGVCELLGAIGLILPAATKILPKLTGVAAAALMVVMVLGFATHVLVGDAAHSPPTVMLGALAAFVSWGRLKAAPTTLRSSFAAQEGKA